MANTKVIGIVMAFIWVHRTSLWLSSMESDRQAGDAGVIPGLGRSPGEANGNPLQHSGLQNPTDRGAWQWQSRGHKEWDKTEVTEHACMPVPPE